MGKESTSCFLIQSLLSPWNLNCLSLIQIRTRYCTVQGSGNQKKRRHLSGSLIIHRKCCSNEMSVPATHTFLIVDFGHVREKVEVTNGEVTEILVNKSHVYAT